MAVIIYIGVNVAKGSLLVSMYLHIYDSVLPPLVRMWWIRCARYLQGQRLEANYSWCMVFPMRPFFLFLILRVTESAWRIR